MIKHNFKSIKNLQHINYSTCIKTLRMALVHDNGYLKSYCGRHALHVRHKHYDNVPI